MTDPWSARDDVTETDILQEALHDGLAGWAADADTTMAMWELEMIEGYAQRFADPTDEELYDDGDAEYDYEGDYDDYDESNDERLEREAREGLEERLRARGFKGKAPLAVVREAFATFVRDFLNSNPDLDQEFEEIFHDIFAGIANEYVIEDAAAEVAEAAFKAAQEEAGEDEGVGEDGEELDEEALEAASV